MHTTTHVHTRSKFVGALYRVISKSGFLLWAESAKAGSTSFWLLQLQQTARQEEQEKTLMAFYFDCVEQFSSCMQQSHCCIEKRDVFSWRECQCKSHTQASPSLILALLSSIMTSTQLQSTYTNRYDDTTTRWWVYDSLCIGLLIKIMITNSTNWAHPQFA